VRPLSPQSIARITSRYFLASYLVVLALSWSFFAAPATEAPLARLFAFAVWLSYGFLYLLPALVLTLVARVLATGRARDGIVPLARRAIVWGTAIASTALTGCMLLLDRSIYELFGFHLNGFVWNLVTTPGGLESLESSESARWSAVLRVALVLLVQAGLLVVCVRLERKPAQGRVCWSARLATICVGLMLTQTIAYAFSQLYGYAPVVVAAARFPGYFPLTIGKLAKSWGFGPTRSTGIELAGPPIALHYPLHEITIDPAAPRPNLVWLVVESLRADALDTEIMPHSVELAARSLTFERHYSGGNGTRMGVFSLFYGLYGSYWFPVLDERRPPVLMDLLERRGYEIDAYSSATFTYPEFERTVFAGLPPEHLHPYHEELSKPESDRSLVSQLEASLASRASDQPFAAFLFFDSTHARYHFLEEDAIRKPYAEDLDYTSMALQRDIELIRNRYLNAAHGVDRCIGEVVELLDHRGLLDDTIVLLTGDHGQEFLEHGRWGHNSSFCEEQVRVPFVLHVPGRAPEKITHLTSHLDVAPTILRALGVVQPESDYSLGLDLLSAEERRFTVVCDWSQLAWIGEDAKITLPFRGPALLQREITTPADTVLPDPERVLALHGGDLVGLLRDMARFGAARP
jgi:membrane-anchored protein YejM (alkaline phosphatase superfamily)